MICLVCSHPTRGVLCSRCSSSLRPHPDRLIGGSLVVHVGLAHQGPARVLVRRLKYEGVRVAALPLAEAMATRVDDPGGSIVPTPRVPLRVWRYGIDPARELAKAYAALVGRPTVDVLRPAIWSPRRAGKTRSARTEVAFGVRTQVRDDVVLIDDVLTTGGTLLAAARAVGERVIGAITATGAGRVKV